MYQKKNKIKTFWRVHEFFLRVLVKSCVKFKVFILNSCPATEKLFTAFQWHMPLGKVVYTANPGVKCQRSLTRRRKVLSEWRLHPMHKINNILCKAPAVAAVNAKQSGRKKGHLLIAGCWGSRLAPLMTPLKTKNMNIVEVHWRRSAIMLLKTRKLKRVRGAPIDWQPLSGHVQFWRWWGGRAPRYPCDGYCPPNQITFQIGSELAIQGGSGLTHVGCWLDTDFLNPQWAVASKRYRSIWLWFVGHVSMRWHLRVTTWASAERFHSSVEFFEWHCQWGGRENSRQF